MKFIKSILIKIVVIFLYFLYVSPAISNLKNKIILSHYQGYFLVKEAQEIYSKETKWKCYGTRQSPIDIVEPMTYAENLELNVDKMNNVLKVLKPLTARKGTFILDGIMGTVTTRDPILFHNKKKDIYLNFQCNRLVFHSPSEHFLYGKKLDVEMQIECSLLPNNSNSDYKNKGLIISYLFKSDKRLDLSTDKVGLLKGFNFDTLDSIYHKTFQKMIKTNKFVMYEGSKSSPSCMDNYLHIVSHIVYNVPKSDVEKIQNQINNTFRLPFGNSRPIQALNGRPIIKNFGNVEMPTFIDQPRK